MGNNLGSNGASSTPFAAIFLDFENVYYFLKNEFADPPELNDHVLEILRSLRNRLADEWGLDSIIVNAYADFERLNTAPQGALYLAGVDTKNVMGTDHKNAADMRLCIDVLEVLYTRREIDTFVLVAGDRDYIPVIQHLRRQAKRVLGVGFRESVSGDLLLNLGDEKFIDARDLLDPSTLERLEDRRREFQARQSEREARFADAARARDEKALQALRSQSPATPFDAASPLPLSPDSQPPIEGQELHPDEALDSAILGATPSGAELDGTAPNGAMPIPNGNGASPNGAPLAPNGEVGHPTHAPLHAPLHVPLHTPEQMKARAMLSDAQFDPVQRIQDEDARVCLGLILHKLRQLQKTRYTNEIWLGPFLRHLTDEMPALADFERRMLLDVLSRSGAISIEKREGEPYPYSVVLVNYAHPDVWDLNPG